MTKPLLQVRNLAVEYRDRLRAGPAVEDLSFDIAEGESLALVGESGCGKSTTALSILRLLPRDTSLSGSVEFDGRELLTLREKELEAVRGHKIGIVFQEPMTTLNPVYTVGWQIGEVLRRHLRLSSRQARARTLSLLRQVALPDPERQIDSFPHQLSGGQRQRVVIAMAIALKPKLLIADEPTTALDASTRGQILSLIDRLRREMNMAALLISHDLPLVSRWTDRTVIMHHGQSLETLPSGALFRDGRHPYTTGLISASIRLQDGLHYKRNRLVEMTASKAETGDFQFELTRPMPLAQLQPPPAPDDARPLLLSVTDLSVRFGSNLALDAVSFDIPRGGSLGVIGESGSGKSTLARAIVGLVRSEGGTIQFDGDMITGLTPRALRPYRRHVQMVFQDPFASLNPRHSVATILGGVLQTHGVALRNERARRIHEALDQVGLPAGAAERLPHEFSGGQRQRIAIARALILRPRLLICDEPTSALDVSVQASILNLLADLKAELGLSYLFISHDLAVIRYIADEVMVIKNGSVVEHGAVETVYAQPAKRYTQELLTAA